MTKITEADFARVASVTLDGAPQRYVQEADDALYDAVMAARDAGLEVFLEVPPTSGKDEKVDITVSVSRPIPLPSDAPESTGMVAHPVEKS